MKVTDNGLHCEINEGIWQRFELWDQWRYMTKVCAVRSTQDNTAQAGKVTAVGSKKANCSKQPANITANTSTRVNVATSAKEQNVSSNTKREITADLALRGTPVSLNWWPTVPQHCPWWKTPSRNHTPPVQTKCTNLLQWTTLIKTKRQLLHTAVCIQKYLKRRQGGGGRVE